jgi:hypothetical protein
MPTVEDLGKLKRAQYPGEYDDIKNDADLGKMFQTDNPGKYDNYTQVGRTGKPKGESASALETAGKVLGFTGDVTTKKVLAPLGKMLTSDPKKQEELSAIAGSKNQQYGSNVLDALIPALKPKVGESPISMAKEAVPLINPTLPWEDRWNRTKDILAAGGRFFANLGTDIATDPLTYTGVGEETQLGKFKKIAEEQKVLGNPIKLKSPLMEGLAKETGMPASAQTVKNVLSTPTGKTAGQRIAQGEQSLANFGPLELTGKAAGKVADIAAMPFDAIKKNAMIQKIDSGIKTLFSTYSDTPEFNNLYHKFRAVTMNRAGLIVENDAKRINSMMQDLSRDLGQPREDIQNQINSLIELSKPRPMSKQTYGKQTSAAIEDFYHEKLLDARIGLKNAQASGNQQLVDTFAKKVADWNGSLNEFKGQYHPPGNIDPKIDAAARDIKSTLENQKLQEDAAGLDPPNLMADINYIPHIITPDTQKSLIEKMQSDNKLPPKFSQNQFKTEVGNYLRRQFATVKPRTIEAWKETGVVSARDAKTIIGKNGLDKMDELLKNGTITPDMYNDGVHSLTMDEVHALPRSEKERVFGKNVPDQIFHTDPTYYTSIRNIRGQRAISSKEFFNEMKVRGLAVPEDQASPNWVTAKQDELAGHKVPPDIARVLNNRNEFMSNPSEFKRLIDAYDKFHNWSKAWTLAIFPSYHTKNMVGNFWNNWLAGVTNPDVYRIAHNIQTGKSVNFTDVLGNKWDSKKLKDTFADLGITRTGQMAADPTTTIQDQLAGGKLLTLGRKNQILELGRKVGTAIEDNARIAHAVDRMKKGDTPEQAALSVKKYLFDYTDLTPFEKKYLNRAFFFYKWTKENLPLQLHELVRQPWKFGAPYKAKYELEKQTDQPNEKYLPEWMQENFPTRIRKVGPNKYEYFMLNNWLPAADLLKLTKLHEVAAQSLSPLPKELIQQLWNYDFYFKKNIDQLEPLIGKRTLGQNEPFLGTQMPSRIVHGLKTVRLLNEIDKMTKPDSDLMQKMMGLFAGKNYSVDFNKAALQNLNQTDKVTQELMQMIMKEKDPRQREYLRALLREKGKEY